MRRRRRININIEGNVSDVEAVHHVRLVMAEGRVSGDNSTYTYLTFFDLPGIRVRACRTESGNDTFTVWRPTHEVS